jgi:hypothetical protein
MKQIVEICMIRAGVMVLNGVLEEINPCDALPCLNGATCQIVSDVEYTCVCAPGSTGTNCDGRPVARH